MKTKREIIKDIKIIPSNLDYISKTGVINGSLLLSIEDAMEEYASQLQDRIKELEEFLQVVVLDFRNEFHITLEDVVARSEELINKNK